MGILSDALRSMQRRKARVTPPRAPVRRGDEATTRENPPNAVPAEPRKETPRELPRLGAEARYVYDERVGIGLDLGMSLERAEDVALLEALLVEGLVPDRLRPIAAAMLDAWGPWEVEAVRVASIKEWMSTGLGAEDIIQSVTRSGSHHATREPTNPIRTGGGGCGKETKEASP